MTKADSWLRKNKLSLSYNKPSYMIIKNRLSKKNNFNLTINNNVISQSNTVKYFGVILDNNLTWQPHIDKIREKLLKSCGMVFKLRHYVPLSTLKLIYYHRRSQGDRPPPPPIEIPPMIKNYNNIA